MIILKRTYHLFLFAFRECLSLELKAFAATVDYSFIITFVLHLTLRVEGTYHQISLPSPGRFPITPEVET